MSEDAVSDAALARALLEGALAVGAKPALTPEQMETVFGLAGEREADGSVAYTRSSLNRAAAIGWNWKTALVSDVYEIAAGEGRSLKRQQWFDQCREMARLYGTGEMDVLAGAAPASDATTAGAWQAVEMYAPFLGGGE